MKRWLLASCILVGDAAKAQGNGEVYAAPGMPVRVSGSVAEPSRRPVPKAVPDLKPKAAASEPAFAPIISPVFPRFWHQPEPARSQGRHNYYQFQQQHSQYPATSLRAGVGGHVWALLTVRADGTVGGVRITRRVMNEEVPSLEAPSSAAEAALEAEVIRVVSQMRFEPSGTEPDTVTVSQRFEFQ